MTPTVFLAAFIVLATAHVVSEGFKYMPGRYFVKPRLMPALALYSMASAETPNPFMIAAIAFGWLGDIFLMIPDPEKTRRYFRPGSCLSPMTRVLHRGFRIVFLRDGMTSRPARGSS